MEWRSKGPEDLLAAAAVLALTVAAIFLDLTGYIRVPLGLLAVLFIPGYAFLAALYPEAHKTSVQEVGDDEEVESKVGLEPLERVALSLGLSIAIVPLLGLALNYTPWGIRLVPIVVTLTGFSVICLALAYWRRQQLPADERFFVQIRVESDFKDQAPLDKALTIALAASVVIAFGVLIYVLVTPRDGEAFTEFYILGQDGKAACYPVNYDGQYHPGTNETNCPRNVGKITIGVVNHEKHSQEYWLRVVWSNETRLPDNTTAVNDFIVVDAWNMTLQHEKVNLEPGTPFKPQYELNYTVEAPPFAGTSRLSFQLYKDDLPPLDLDKATWDDPYRRLHLWIQS